MKKTTLLLFVLFFLACHGITFSQEAATINKISITGNERIDTAMILNVVKSKEKEPYSLDKVREDMKNIYKTGFFSDVQIDEKDSADGKIITFIVIERPPIKAILLSGNKKIKTPDLVEKIKIRSNTVLNTEKVKESIDELKKLYASKGYYATRITYNIDYEEEYSAIVNINVEEPERAYVRKITFTGNNNVKSKELFKYMRTQEKGILSWVTGSGILDEDTLQEDRKNIEASYNDKGYVRVKVGAPDIAISKDGKSIAINIPIEEGEIYTIGSTDFSGDLLLSKEELTGKIKSKSGNVFRSSLFHEDVLTLTDMYQDQGYAFCDVAPLTLIDDNTKTISLTFDITKGNEIYFNRINILGNTRTRDKVIRRELKIAEGDRFSSSAIKESKRKLKNTTFFNNIDMKFVKTDDPHKVNTDLTIEERATGSLGVGVGYSTSEKAFVTASISQDNFMGTGRRIFVDASVGSVTQQFRFSYLEPYVFDKKFSAGFSAYNYIRYYDTYDYEKQGGNISLTRPLTDYLKASARYRLENQNVTNLSDTVSSYIKAQEGRQITSALSFSLNKNTIDDVLNPTRGMNAEIIAEMAGGLFGGDNKFVSLVATYGRYFPIKFLESAFFVKGTGGMIRGYGGKEVPIYEKFYVGGINTIRGFKYGEAGPLDENGEAIGSKNQLYANLEWIFPLYKPAGLKGVIFFDAGNGFDNSSDFTLKTAAGLGIRWFSPLGPIRLELGFNLNRKDDEKGSVFDFTIGTQY